MPASRYDQIRRPRAPATARSVCLPLRLSFLGRIFRPPDFCPPARAPVFFDKIGDPFGRHARPHHRAWAARTHRKHGLAGSTMSNPANNELLTQSERGLLSRGGKLPKTDSRNRNRRSRHSLCNPGNPGRRSPDSPGSRRSHVLPARRSWPPPRVPCRRHRTSPS
jgi:hypothetical protein